MRFRNRADAGRWLAKGLRPFVASGPDLLILGLPRGGVPVAWEVAQYYRAPLDVFLVRKLGAPDQPELAIGAIATGGTRVLNHDALLQLSITLREVEQITERERRELDRRERAYRDDAPPLGLTQKTVVLVDDGLATGSTMRAAILAARTQSPRRIIVGVPTASPIVCSMLATIADDVVSVLTPEPYQAVGAWYDDFRQVTDEEVKRILDRARESYPRQGA